MEESVKLLVALVVHLFPYFLDDEQLKQHQHFIQSCVRLVAVFDDLDYS